MLGPFIRMVWFEVAEDFDVSGMGHPTGDFADEGRYEIAGMARDDEPEVGILPQAPEGIVDSARGGFAVAGRENYDCAFDTLVLKNPVDLLMEWRIDVAEMFRESDEVSFGQGSIQHVGV